MLMCEGEENGEVGKYAHIYIQIKQSVHADVRERREWRSEQVRTGTCIYTDKQNEHADVGEVKKMCMSEKNGTVRKCVQAHVYIHKAGCGC